MNWYQIKEANRQYWIMHGELIPESWDDASVLEVYRTYTWRRSQSPGFEAAWAARQAKMLD